jgi:hypothetical protein
MLPLCLIPPLIKPNTPAIPGRGNYIYPFRQLLIYGRVTTMGIYARLFTGGGEGVVRGFSVGLLVGSGVPPAS